MTRTHWLFIAWLDYFVTIWVFLRKNVIYIYCIVHTILYGQGTIALLLYFWAALFLTDKSEDGSRAVLASAGTSLGRYL